MRIEEICQGHLVKITKRCYKCIRDDFNKKCEYYKPAYLVIYEVVDNNSKRMDDDKGLIHLVND